MMATIFRRSDTQEHGAFGCMRSLASLQDYLDGNLDALDEQKLREHLDACERCGLREEAYRAVQDGLTRRRDRDEAMVDRLQQFAAGLMRSEETSRQA